MDKIPDAFAIGFIMYDVLCTRQDVSYALSATSRYESNLEQLNKNYNKTQGVKMMLKEDMPRCLP